MMFLNQSAQVIRSLWKSLSIHKNVVKDRPWIILGDFNACLDPAKRSNGGSKFTTAMHDFRDCVEEIDVEDIAMTGLNFTWNKKPGDDGGLLKKLDRVLGNSHFMSIFPLSYAHFLPFMLSDHTPAVLVMPKISKAKPKPFKVYNYLTDKDDFIPIVRNVWNSKIDGFAMFSLVSKLKLLKKPLRKLNFEQGNLFENVVRLRADLAAVQSSMNVLGQSSNVIPFSNPDSLFVKNLPISEALNLVRVISNEEIKLALFDINGNKASGPDGFSSQFFKDSWSVVGDDVCKAVR
nr:hypothetical protein [Tanacetum cinerariifolium]